MLTAGRTAQTPLRRLARMPSGTRVQLRCGTVYVRAERRWMQAGRTGDPITSTALLRANSGRMPVMLVPAYGREDVA